MCDMMASLGGADSWWRVGKSQVTASLFVQLWSSSQQGRGGYLHNLIHSSFMDLFGEVLGIYTILHTLHLWT